MFITSWKVIVSIKIWENYFLNCYSIKSLIIVYILIVLMLLFFYNFKFKEKIN